MIRLFPSSEIVVPSDPEAHGFYDLELPDAFRWIRQEAKCWLPIERLASLAHPMLRVTATAGSQERFLSVYLNDHFLETQRIDRYGSYYFHVPSRPSTISGLLEICLRVNYAVPVASDPRTLGIVLYGIDAIDLDSDWNGFEERRYLADQVRVFRSTPFPLSRLLEDYPLTRDSLVLDVGAGIGWSTMLLAAKTGARVFAVDLHRYDSSTGDSFRGELLKRFKRHLPVLIQESGLERFRHLEQLVDSCSFFTMDAQQLLFRDNLFDFIFSMNAFEHIPDPGQALQEMSRVLKPGGYVFLVFNPLYFSDSGHHLAGLIDIPWVHLLYERSDIKKLILEAGKIPNEVDNILNSLNGYTPQQYFEIFESTDLQVLEKYIERGFTYSKSEQSEAFVKLKEKYSEEALTTLGMAIVLKK